MNLLELLHRLGVVLGRKKRSTWVADFETTTDPDDCRVWGWGLCPIEGEELDDVEIGQDLEAFFERIRSQDMVIYFHNLAFDGVFILDLLFRMGYKHVGENARRGEFTTLISNMGKFYSMSVTWESGHRTEFRDSLKKLPMTVSQVAKTFKLDESKGSIDYAAPRPVGYVPTVEERDYIARDVLIVVKALHQQFAEGMVKLTVGSDALAEFKKVMGTRLFQLRFPVLPAFVDEDIRAAYRGGFTYADDRFKGKVLNRSGRVYDVNSLYPSVMYDELLPYGEPVRFEGKPPETGNYPLWIASVTFIAKLKPEHIPCIQVKGSSFFANTEYQTVINDPVTMMVTNVDLALWRDHYNLEILSWNGGYRFRGSVGVFREFIDKWMKVKAESTGGRRLLAKLMLNSLYGKFATNPNVTPKYPVYEEQRVKLKLGDEETRDPVYTAMGVFITAYARDKTIRAAQQHYDVFAYADTDSLHLLIDEDPETLTVDPHELGAWKYEYSFTSALFIRAKAYLEELHPEHRHDETDCEREEHTLACNYVTHIAGLPEKIAHKLVIDDIVGGRSFDGKLIPKRVPGGIVLESTSYTINY